MDTRVFRSLLCVVYAMDHGLFITHSARHLEYERAIVVCYFTDDSWPQYRLLDHGYNIAAMTLGPAAMLCVGFCTAT